jgi:medium-chain acyl-[acyl-carrier-protein] hydrolase
LAARPSRPAELPAPTNVDRELVLAVRRSDLDVAGHVNNASFIEWSLEAVPDELWREADLLSLEIAFLAECRRGQTVLSRASWNSETAPCEISHQLVRPDDGREVVRARSTWRANPGPVIP